MIHLELYAEEPSAKAALSNLVPAIVGDEISFEVHSFRGKDDLLQNLESRLRGYAAWIPSEYRIVVLVDEDRQDCQELKAKLFEAAQRSGISDRVLNRIAVEELEAWFLGDVDALREVYPRLPESLASRTKYRDPDRVAGGTWEALDRLLREYNYSEGLLKTATAAKVSRYMNPESNRSKSFQVFRDGLRQLVDIRHRGGTR